MDFKFADEDFFDFEIIDNTDSLRLSIELHYEYKNQGFTPQEFYEYLTGIHSINIDDWSDAVIKLSSYISSMEVSKSVH